MMEQKKIDNAFVGRSDGYVCTGQVFTDSDIVEYDIVEKVVKLGDDPHDFVLDHDCVEVSRMNRQEYINSFRNDVGVLNIMKKVAISGENPFGVSLGDDVIDLDPMQLSTEDAIKAMSQGVQAYSGLDPELKKSSIDEFMSTVDAGALNEWLQKKMAEKSADGVQKEENK